MEVNQTMSLLLVCRRVHTNEKVRTNMGAGLTEVIRERQLEARTSRKTEDGEK